MNFKSNKLTIQTFFLIIFLSLINLSLVFPQLNNETGSPYIEQIALKKFGLQNNNSTILQDNNGYIYIANSNGIIFYDGNSLELFKVAIDPIIALGKDNKIIVAAYNQFGYLGYNNYKELSIIPFETGELDFGQAKKILTKDDQIYLSTDKGTYIYHNNSFTKLIEEKNTNIFKVNNSIYISSLSEGLYEFKDNLNLLLDTNKIKGEVIDILSYDDGIIIKTLKTKGFIYYNQNSTSTYKTEGDDFIHDNGYSCGLKIANGDYIIGTKVGGIIILDSQGKVRRRITKACDLYDTQINALFSDRNKNIWALHNHGISRIEYPSPYSYFNHNHGLKGNITDVIRFQNNIYVSTSQGVYMLESAITEAKFDPINGIKSSSFKFHLLDNKLFVSTAVGIYQIKEKEGFLFYNRESGNIKSTLHSKFYPNIIFLGHSDGFSALRYTNGILIIQGKLEGINDEITSIAEDKDGTIWLASKHKGIYRIPPFNQYSQKLDFEHYTIENGLPDLDWIHLFSLNEGIVFSTSKGLYRFNDTSEVFLKDSLLNYPGYKSESEWAYPLSEDSDLNLWINVIKKDKAVSNAYVVNRTPDTSLLYKPLPLNRLSDFFISSIHPDPDGIIWFGGFEGIVRFNTKKDKTSEKPNVSISTIAFGEDSLFVKNSHAFQNSVYKANPRIPYYLNSLQIKFASNSYESEEFIQFSSFLEGLDENWSDWNLESSKEYPHLREGYYTFHVKAKDIYDNTTNIASYSFHITAPFYRSIIAYIIYLLFAIFLIILIVRWRAFYFARERFRLENIINERTEEVVIQKEKADKLLERVLPKNTAQELKSGKRAGPYHYKMATVLFSDIQGFTKISEELESEHLIDELDKFFLKFDSVAEKYNIEKIKTIGDAYMCAGGIPEKNRTNPVEVVLAAIEMQNYMKTLKFETRDGVKRIWDLRIGIDTGPVVAGVLGRSKISYDIWGGTVNTASRMESSGEPGKINVTENTFLLVKEFFICKYRGKMPVKYKGEIDMYFVEGFMPHLASDIKQQIPNKKFFTHLQLLRFNDIEEFVLEKLENGLPSNLYYHDVKHTIDVVTQVELIGRAEGITDEEILVLRTAALFHDMGHLVDYDTHEDESVKLAQKILPNYQYNSEQIDQICKLISITKMPPQPNNRLESIMCDADLDYLGRSDFVPVSNALFREYHERGKIESLIEWNKHQMSFIQNHHYFTETAQKLREVNKIKQLAIIKDEIQKQLLEEDE